MRPKRLQKQTRIVATIAHMRSSAEHLRELYEEGMNVVRINTAHADHEGALKIINDTREASEKLAIMIDTKGPEVRTSAPEDAVTLVAEQEVIIDGHGEEPSTNSHIHTSLHDIAKHVPKGQRILINDGAIELEVVEQREHELLCSVINAGSFHGRKSVNIPGIHIPLPALTEKDEAFIRFAAQQDVAFIAHSFVRNKEDLMEIQKILDEEQSQIKIISKIENQEGVDNIHEILEHCYGIMVARGDLGIEIAAEKIPSIQKHLVKTCIEKHKPVIIATQMMKSMVDHPRPTRAEVNDVANAIYDGVDAVMLSEETAVGNYPTETVGMVTQIAIETEAHARDHHHDVVEHLKGSIPHFLAHSAIEGAKELNAEAIVIDTKQGRTARTMAAFRSRTPIHCRCYNRRVMRELALSYGIHTDYMEPKETTDEFVQYALQRLMEKEYAKQDHLVVVVAGNFGPTEEPSFMEISTICDMLDICRVDKHE